MEAKILPYSPDDISTLYIQATVIPSACSMRWAM